ncbi:energy transducer TonB [Nitratidesulfovibrio sp. D1]|uniref:energy transducer TonB n=1 Tax=Nitratidesulfovibrio sp. D1 TaxID=3440151 RepID=UPI003EBB168C
MSGRDWMVSLALHCGLAGVLAYGATRAEDTPRPVERVYEVSLAEFAPAPPEIPAAPPPPAEPAPPPPPSSPPPRRETKTIAPKKKQDAPPVQAEAPPPPAPPETVTDPRPQAEPSPEAGRVVARYAPRNVSGYLAYESDKVDERPAVARRVMPDYPRSARRQGIQGQVVVRIVVDKDGNPQACAVHSAAPEGYFEEVALQAARQMRFIPGKVKGTPVNTLVTVPFVFRLQ